MRTPASWAQQEITRFYRGFLKYGTEFDKVRAMLIKLPRRSVDGERRQQRPLAPGLLAQGRLRPGSGGNTAAACEALAPQQRSRAGS